MTYKELVQTHGDAHVTFTSYSKYEFYFRGVTADRKTLLVIVGGEPEDIYKMHVDTDWVTVASLGPSYVKIGNGELIEVTDES